MWHDNQVARTRDYNDAMRSTWRASGASIPPVVAPTPAPTDEWERIRLFETAKLRGQFMMLIRQTRGQFMLDVRKAAGSERFKAARDYATSKGGDEFDVVAALKPVLQGDEKEKVIRYAKRQHTWERAVPSIFLLWMHEDDSDDDIEDLINELKRPRLSFEDVPDEELREFLETFAEADDEIEDLVNELKRPRLPFEDVPDEELREFLETFVED